MGLSKSHMRKSASPYARYNKSPTQYSDAYQSWRAAVINGNRTLARRWAREHARRFAPWAVETTDTNYVMES